jgi:hypothetical protein
MTRFTSRFLVDLLIRRTQSEGGFATIIAPGDERAGVILVQCRYRDSSGPLLERRFSLTGKYEWEAVGAVDSDEKTQASYVQRRRSTDPDLWVIELDVADAPRLVAEWTALT